MEPHKESMEERFKKKFAPFIAYRAKSTMLDMSNTADIVVNELEHCEDDLIAFLRVEITTALAEERSRIAGKLARLLDACNCNKLKGTHASTVGCPDLRGIGYNVAVKDCINQLTQPE